MGPPLNTQSLPSTTLVTNMKFSDIYTNTYKSASFPPKGKFFHITPSSNIPSILSSGLVRGTSRNTSGVETQKKIYLMNTVWNIDNPFPSNEGWHFRDMSVIEIDMSGMSPLPESDPEYDNGQFFMHDGDIPPQRIKNVGKVQFRKQGDKFFGIQNDGYKYGSLNEYVEHRGDDWVVLNKSRTEVLGTHPNKHAALAQLAAIEISKQKHEAAHEEPLPEYTSGKKVGVISKDKITGYAHEYMDGSLDVDGLRLPSRAAARIYGFEIVDLPKDYETQQGKHFHERK